ncbi:MAG: hypothetical protein SchgKO_01350 [Schleiferiaceae bacterium]
MIMTLIKRIYGGICVALFAALWSPSASGQEMLGEMVIEGDLNRSSADYKGSHTRHWDLIHTQLKVEFDWEKTQVNGAAKLVLAPWFLPKNQLILDAKMFSISNVIAEVGKENIPLEYIYDQTRLIINMDREIQKDEILNVYIEYTASPNEIPSKGGRAITADKGLYFINPSKNATEYVPQIWTQGEPDANSGWFPTIDHPNERMTTEIYITVEDSLLTISNGVLTYSDVNPTGKRTDHWLMEKPHAPYLVMMAIGPWHVEKDTWRNIPLEYAGEKTEAANLRRIFHKTPEMLSFFSKRLGVSYPWPSLRQVLVREYVSGAMENTTGIIYGDFVYSDSLSYNDNPHEDIIAHEIFHHWFGDLVTCEAWAQIPLNESFATYGEVLWKRYAHGADSADYHRYKDYQNYLMEFYFSKREKLIRFDYEAIDEMFDNHSYAKGGRILHQLRMELGDTIFFTSLQYYLEKHAYSAVEVHDLRQAFEDVSGRDLNYFFDQWFFTPGHPVCETSSYYDSKKDELVFAISQKQSLDYYPVYRFTIPLVWKDSKGVHREYAEISSEFDTVRIEWEREPDWMAIDPQHDAMVEWKHDYSFEELRMFIEESPFAIQRLQALDAMEPDDSFEEYTEVLEVALQDSFPAVAELALEKAETILPENKEALSNVIRELAKTYPHTGVRSDAMTFCMTELKIKDVDLYRSGIQFSSYKVQGAALNGLYYVRTPDQLELARKKFPTAKNDLLDACARVLAAEGDETDYQKFMAGVKSSPAMAREDWAVALGEWAGYTSVDSQREEIITLLSEWAFTPGVNYSSDAQYALDYMLFLWMDRLENDFLSGADRKKLNQLINQYKTPE